MNLGDCSGFGPISKNLNSAFHFNIGSCSILFEPISKNLSSAFHFNIGSCSILNESQIVYRINFNVEIELTETIEIEIKIETIELSIGISSANELNKMKFKDIAQKPEYKGDAFTITASISGYDVAGNFTNFLLQFEIWDQKGNSLKKANANVSGGNDSQIEITDPTNKKFEIHINTNETINFADNCEVEFRIETAIGENRKTVRTNIIFKDKHINWNAI